MDPNYSSNCRQPGYYNIPDRGEQQESRQHPPLPQHLPHYAPHHQLPFNPALIPTPPGYAVDHPENLSRRDSFPTDHGGSSSMLRSVYGVSGPRPAGSNVLAQQGNPGIHSFPHRDQDPTPSQGPRPTSGPTNLSFTPAVVSQAILTELSVRSEPVQDCTEQMEQNVTATTSNHNNKSATPASTSHKSLQPPTTNDSTASKPTNQLQAQSSRINSNDCQLLRNNSNNHQPLQSGSNECQQLPGGSNDHLPWRTGLNNHLPPGIIFNDPKPNRMLPPKKLTQKIKIKRPLLTVELPGYLEYRYASDEDKGEITGVVAKETVDEGAEFGPFEGTLMDEEIGAPKETTWELCLDGKVLFYLNGRRKEEFNWMSQVRCAHSEDQQNVEVFQYYGQIYYRTTKVIDPGSELRTFYSQEYAERIGFKTKLSELKYNEDKDSFQCSECNSQFATAKLFTRHLKLEHHTDGINDMQPVVSWRRKGHKLVEKKPKGPVGRAAKKLKEQLKDKPKPTEKKEFICGTCQKVFQTEGRLRAHELFHEFSDEHTCPICGEKQMNIHTLTKHMSHHEERPYQCDKCDKAYKNRSALNRHDREIHQGLDMTMFACKFCAVKFARKTDCTKHEKTHKRMAQKQKADAMEELPREREEVETENALEADSQESTEIDSSKTKTPAKQASEAQEKPQKRGRKSVKEQKEKEQPKGPKDMLGKTVDYYSKPRPFKCRFCPKTYMMKKMAFEHEQQVHERIGKFKCTICDRAFMNENRFLAHIRTHDVNRFYRCKLCPRSFGSESALNNHQGEHTGLKPFKCELCGRGFRIRKAVCEHKRRMHQNRKPRFFCSFCEKGFHERGALNKHEQRHRGIRPFVCLTCGRGFTEKCALVAHTKSKHSDKRPFTCEVCGKSFALNQNYLYHIFRHKQRAQECLPGYNASFAEAEQLPMREDSQDT